MRTCSFCGYILYDTSNLIHKYGVDDYVPAALELYLDVLNLFLKVPRLCCCPVLCA